MQNQNQDADLADYLIAHAAREIRRYPRSPVVVSPATARDIDISGVFRMSPEQIDEACAMWAAA